MKKLLAFALVLCLADAASARRMAPPVIPLRVAGADAVFVGKVKEIADKPVKAELEKGDDRMMLVATVSVSSDLLGRAGRTVEVGFFAPMGRTPGTALAKGEEVLFFARKHPTKKATYVIENYYGTVSSKDNDGFKNEVAEAKKAAAALDDPMKALKSKDAAERTMAAILLVTRYKTPSGDAKQEAVPAAESKLILEALAEGEWGGRGGITPLSVFYRLGATEKDGWTPPKGGDFAASAKTWLKDNAGKFKLTRFARPVSGPSEEPK